MNRRTILSLLAGASLTAFTTLAKAAAGFVLYRADGFKKLVDEGATIIVHVHAEWCPSCTRQLVTLNKMVEEAGYGHVHFITVNFDTDTEFLMAHRVTAQSTILVIKAGREVSRIVGITRSHELRTRIDAAI